MTSNNARIEIVSSPRPIHIDRTLPSNLQDHLRQNEWESFCNNIDTVLHPLDVALEVCQIIYFGAAALCFVALLVLLLPVSNHDHSLFILVVSIFFFVASNMMCSLYLRHKLDRTHGQLEMICHTMTNLKATSLSFHLRAKPVNFFIRGAEGGFGPVCGQTYIEVFVRYAPPPTPASVDKRANSGVGSVSSIGGASGNHFSLASHRPPPENVAFDVKQRLEQLEQIRADLSEPEYHDKRAAILDRV